MFYVLFQKFNKSLKSWSLDDTRMCASILLGTNRPKTEELMGISEELSASESKIYVKTEDTVQE